MKILFSNLKTNEKIILDMQGEDVNNINKSISDNIKISLVYTNENKWHGNDFQHYNIQITLALRSIIFILSICAFTYINFSFKNRQAKPYKDIGDWISLTIVILSTFRFIVHLIDPFYTRSVFYAGVGLLFTHGPKPIIPLIMLLNALFQLDLLDMNKMQLKREFFRIYGFWYILTVVAINVGFICFIMLFSLQDFSKFSASLRTTGIVLLIYYIAIMVFTLITFITLRAKVAQIQSIKLTKIPVILMTIKLFGMSCCCVTHTIRLAKLDLKLVPNVIQWFMDDLGYFLTINAIIYELWDRTNNLIINHEIITNSTKEKESSQKSANKSAV